MTRECQVRICERLGVKFPGPIGTVDVGIGFPRDGTDGEWKIAGRDATLTMKTGSQSSPPAFARAGVAAQWDCLEQCEPVIAVMD